MTFKRDFTFYFINGEKKTYMLYPESLEKNYSQRIYRIRVHDSDGDVKRIIEIPFEQITRMAQEPH